MGYYDADAPDPGSSRTGTSTYRVRCLDCPWSFTGHGTLSASSAIAQGNGHHQETGHAIAGKNGLVQARWTRTTVARQGAA